MKKATQELESPLDVATDETAAAATEVRDDPVLNETGDVTTETEAIVDQQLIDESDQEGKMFNAPNEEATETTANQDEANAENNNDDGVIPDGNETGELLEPMAKEGGQEENLTLEENNQTLNDSESILEITNAESETGGPQAQQQQLQQNESLDEEATTTAQAEKTSTSTTTTSTTTSSSLVAAIQHQQKKEAARRKQRQQNRFADGNLIPEEDDNQDSHRLKSPGGPPPLEPISQLLDHDILDKSNLTHPKHDHDLLATTPDKMDITLDEEFQETEIEVKPSREELIARYHAAIEERERLQNVNNQLHHKLADSFRKKKSEDTQNQLIFDKTTQEQEQRYSKYLANIESLKKEMERVKIESERRINELKYKCEIKEEIVEAERMKMTKFKKDTALKTVYAQNGKRLKPAEIEFCLERERQKELDVISYRIENIKLNNQLKKSEEETRQKENTGEAKLEMIDFEQLKIENQTYNEKIEERNEELLKLRKKINNTVQISSHVKEKLQNVLAENEKQKERLAVYDDQVKKSRDVLNKIKQSKDSLRVDNARLKQKSGLLGNNVLLRDFEDCVDRTDSLEAQIEQLKRRHAALLLDSKSIKQRINQVKTENVA